MHRIGAAIVRFAYHKVEAFAESVIVGAIVASGNIEPIGIGAVFDLLITGVDEEEFIDRRNTKNLFSVIARGDAVIIDIVNHESNLGISIV